MVIAIFEVILFFIRYQMIYLPKHIYNKMFKTRSFIDIRDNKKYKTIKIGKQTWMAENLNYSSKDFFSLHYGKYGRYYDWQTANIVAPKGWHLPSDDEWSILSKSLGGSDVAGRKMKSFSGWWSVRFNGNGSNSSGFSGLPGGYKNSSGRSGMFIEDGYWWSSTESETKSNEAWFRGLSINFNDLYRDTQDKELFFNVRCIKDS